jgi:hypothetical protein
MVFADRQDVGLMKDTHLHRGRWMVPGAVVYLILCTRIAGGMPRPSCSDHGLSVGLLPPKPIRDANCHGCGGSDLDGASIGVRWCTSRAVAMLPGAEPPWRAPGSLQPSAERPTGQRLSQTHPR